jgi:hypothetical protein
MDLHAAPALGRKDRHVRRSYVRIGAQVSRHRVAYALEEALRLVDLPGEDEGRVYHFRRLSVHSIPADASRTVWIDELQKSLSTLAQRAVHGASPLSYTSDAVYFDNEDEALEAILQAALLPDSRPAWFWPAVAGVASASPRTAYIPAILDRLRAQRTPQSAAAIIIAALGASDAVTLLSAISAFTLRDWLRALETPGTFLSDAVPMRLPEALTATLEQAARRFGWSDHRTLWLATQAVLSFSPPTQSCGVAVRKGQATLRQLEAATLSRKAEQQEPATNSRLAATVPVHRPIVFDDDNSAEIALPSAQETPPASTSELRAEPQPDAPPRHAPILRGERTRGAGLYFLLHVLRHLGIAKALEACPALVDADFVAHIIRRLAAHAGVAATDEILCAASTVPLQGPLVLSADTLAAPNIWPLGFNTSAAPTDAGVLLRVWVLAVRRWCWRFGAIGVRDIVSRPGRVWLTRTDLDVTLALSDADVRIRRLGLDIDPGWLPWFGRFGLVVRFHYRDREDGGDSC